MRNKLIHLSFCAVFLLTNCSNGQGEHTSAGSQWLSPLAGTSVNLGDSVNLQLNLSNIADSVVFYTDGIKLGNSKGDSVLQISTTKLSLGIKTIAAKVYRGTEVPEEISTNIVVKSTLVPEKLKWSVQATFNHDTSS